MKALAGFIVSGRFQAILVAALSGVLAFLLPPFTTLAHYLGAAVIALVTLRIGTTQGLQVLIVATLLTVLFYLAAGTQAATVAVTVLLLWLPCWLVSAVLRQTVNLAYATLTAAGLGIVALMLVYGMAGDPAPWWLERLQSFEAELDATGLFPKGIQSEELLADLSRLLTGVVLASLVLSTLCSVLLGRWWQALLVNPGGLRSEFIGLRLGQGAGLLTLVLMLAAQFTQGVASDMAAQSAMVLLVPYLLVGLAVAHGVVTQTGRGNGWLIAIYIMLAILPQAALMLAGIGLLDTWIDFRRRLGGAGGKPGK
ncbi:MAG: hypothetical protein OEU44_07430 [Gammaproteobacteria bacterium]|nr:hypothetical protein [Gammaproteobacteria bacterium]